MYNKYLVHYDKLLITADSDSDKRQTRPLVREGAPQRQDRDWAKWAQKL
jgi:hypothetical protein